jgi:DnaJ-domain-containing protein 1
MERDAMKSQPPNTIPGLLWEIMRTAFQVFWQSSANPARALARRQQALALLSLPPTATQLQIKRRYRELAKRHHPDHGGDARQMQLLNEAYQILVRD